MCPRLLLALALYGLSQPSVAEQALPAYVLQLPPSVGVVLVADTGASALYRYRNGTDGISLVDTHYMSIGENGVGKTRPWDRRTPIGIYFVSDELDTATLHPKYGVMAFPLDYPSTWDRLHERSGDGIWLHGVDEKDGQRPPLDTDGCLALPNASLLEIADDIVPLSTPVIIARQMRWADRGDLAELGSDLQAAVDAWAQSYKSGDLHRYFSLYDDDFVYRGMDRTEWLAFRTATVGSRALDELIIKGLTLLAVPDDDALYLSRFEQTLVEGARRVTTMKRLYWRRTGKGVFRIVAEDNG